MTDEELKEIEARLNAATPGPWRRDRNWHIVGPDNDWEYQARPEYIKHPMKTAMQFQQIICQVHGPGSANHAVADAYLIANAPTDIRKLLDEVKRPKTGIICPYCGDDDYDLPGLKHHFWYFCDEFRRTPLHV